MPGRTTYNKCVGGVFLGEQGGAVVGKGGGYAESRGTLGQCWDIRRLSVGWKQHPDSLHIVLLWDL